jgi:hypothetical protein
MDTVLWFLLGCWSGGAAAFLLYACMHMARDSAQRSDAEWALARYAERVRWSN